jgi:hypothetical protein
MTGVYSWLRDYLLEVAVRMYFSSFKRESTLWRFQQSPMVYWHYKMAMTDRKVVSVPLQ